MFFTRAKIELNVVLERGVFVVNFALAYIFFSWIAADQTSTQKERK